MKAVTIYYKDEKPTRWKEDADIQTTLSRIGEHLNAWYENGGGLVEKVIIKEISPDKKQNKSVQAIES